MPWAALSACIRGRLAGIPSRNGGLLHVTIASGREGTIPLHRRRSGRANNTAPVDTGEALGVDVHMLTGTLGRTISDVSRRLFLGCPRRHCCPIRMKRETCREPCHFISVGRGFFLSLTLLLLGDAFHRFRP